MKKIKKNNEKPYSTNDASSTVNEPFFEMRSINKMQIAIADFTHNKFKRIADKVPFTQAEWASILHLSERTLQRYAKDNKSFEGIYVDRLLQIDNLINLGLETFESADAFYSWLKKPKNILGNQLTFEALLHTQGINELYNQLQRIQHGVYT